MRAIEELVGVYDADSGVVGELTYVVKARLGGIHCSLCDITHGRVRERSDWRACRDRLAVPFSLYHRNDQPPEVRSAAGGATPVVAARVGADVVVLLSASDISACDGSPERLMDAVAARADALGFQL